MRDWLTQKIKTDVSERAQGWRSWVQDIVDLTRAAYDALRNPRATADAVVFDDEDNYNASLDMAWKAISTSLVIFGLIFTLLSLLTSEDLGINEFFLQFIAGLYMIFGILIGFAGLHLGLKFWTAPEPLTSKRLFHLYVTWAGPSFVLNYVAGSAVAVVGVFFMVNGENILLDLYRFGVGIFVLWSFCALMFYKFGYPWWKTVVSYFVGAIGLVFAIAIVLGIIFAPFADG